MVLLQFQGLAESGKVACSLSRLPGPYSACTPLSAGEAVASRCLLYEITGKNPRWHFPLHRLWTSGPSGLLAPLAHVDSQRLTRSIAPGALVLFFLIALGASAMVVVYWALRTQRLEWNTVKATQAARDVCILTSTCHCQILNQRDDGHRSHISVFFVARLPVYILGSHASSRFCHARVKPSSFCAPNAVCAHIIACRPDNGPSDLPCDVRPVSTFAGGRILLDVPLPLFPRPPCPSNAQRPGTSRLAYTGQGGIPASEGEGTSPPIPRHVGVMDPCQPAWRMAGAGKLRSDVSSPFSPIGS